MTRIGECALIGGPLDGQTERMELARLRDRWEFVVSRLLEIHILPVGAALAFRPPLGRYVLADQNSPIGPVPVGCLYRFVWKAER